MFSVVNFCGNKLLIFFLLIIGELSIVSTFFNIYTLFDDLKYDDVVELLKNQTSSHTQIRPKCEPYSNDCNDLATSMITMKYLQFAQFGLMFLSIIVQIIINSYYKCVCCHDIECQYQQLDEDRCYCCNDVKFDNYYISIIFYICVIVTFGGCIALVVNLNDKFSSINCEFGTYTVFNGYVCLFINIFQLICTYQENTNKSKTISIVPPYQLDDTL